MVRKGIKQSHNMSMETTKCTQLHHLKMSHSICPVFWWFCQPNVGYSVKESRYLTFVYLYRSNHSAITAGWWNFLVNHTKYCFPRTILSCIIFFWQVSIRKTFFAKLIINFFFATFEKYFAANGNNFLITFQP